MLSFVFPTILGSTSNQIYNLWNATGKYCLWTNIRNYTVTQAWVNHNRALDTLLPITKLLMQIKLLVLTCDKYFMKNDRVATLLNQLILHTHVW